MKIGPHASYTACLSNQVLDNAQTILRWLGRILSMKQDNVPDAELLIASGCAHCPSVLTAMTELLKQGKIGRLDIINIATRPDAARARSARGVPWMKIGPFELVGAHTPGELAKWTERATQPEGRQEYLNELLTQGELEQAITTCRRDPGFLTALLELAADLDTPFAVRIGVGAVFEELGPEGRLRDFVEIIATRLTNNPEPQIRADGAHFLGLTGSPAAIEDLQKLSGDTDTQVREIAEEALQQLTAETSE